ncbi:MULTISPECIES: FMN-binding glutamate synthase family protein [Methylosinus]|uniref:FMN-binding glutamate synthase family protein n=1 Tax=Methylosinus trichosporium (strain ATCC 35070 / NCIMB 11131 / UNIQEM 75 / OB3b) TaxID=595536 RepID=A0A2D2CXB3_METT3|nr:MULTISPECIES: FMN-binding glutamate synthase family protein [Methylosinus]ATQ67391.1 FMN-binding glutamate synthase family protein [Methylosinus trichosporium OB3b]OBS51596.1 glutamate synthase [Methylosinus sp. 3S-1]
MRLTRLLLLPFTPRLVVLTLCVIGFFGCAVAARGEWGSPWFAPMLAFGGSCALGLRDLLQTEHAILRGYPISGHLRFLLETIRPELRQYFFEDNKDGRPFSRDRRAIVYQRAKMNVDKRPFGTEVDVYAEGYEWLRHSIAARPVSHEPFRTRVGAACAQPYDMSFLNISAMSFGALGANAIRALALGARKGGFALDTGEGGFSPYHQEAGGDIVWQIASGYFGCRTREGLFDPDKFAAVASSEQIKMIEVKLSQGAKPGHGGVLPGAKVTEEIARIRGVPQGEDCVSPATHSAFSTPIELLQFLARLRALSGGKPVGFKLCVGQPSELFAICKAMVETKLAPDFIVVDGKEGGTGSAPMEFMDHIGMPMREGLALLHHALIGIGARDSVRIGVAGQIVTAFDMARALALGADWCNSARGFMFALGCIQSQSCHTGHCPTGVATQDASRGRALVVSDKAERVRNFHRATLVALGELAAAAGLDHPSEFGPEHFCRRLSMREIASFADLYPTPAPGAFLAGEIDPRLAGDWRRARPDSFRPTPNG